MFTVSRDLKPLLSKGELYISGFRARQHLRLLPLVMNDDDDNDGQMIFGNLKHPDILY